MSTQPIAELVKPVLALVLAYTTILKKSIPTGMINGYGSRRVNPQTPKNVVSGIGNFECSRAKWILLLSINYIHF